jgi:fermentation-respiration switch protein FrsA (DUF1100 family)
MLKSLLSLCVLLLLTPPTFPEIPTTSEDPEFAGIIGNWQGVLKVSGVELRIVFTIQEKDGVLSATMDSPDQGVTNIPTSEVILENDHLIIKAAALGGIYEGQLESDTGIAGTWTQRGAAYPLELLKTPTATGSKRPQEPKGPFPYHEEDVEYANPKDHVKLAGTLTFPKSQGPFPAVLLIAGSGPQDRNGTVFGHKPFWVLADHLTRKGIAVLRFDERGVGASTGDNSRLTTPDLAQDVLAGVEYLKTRDKIDGKQIGLVGHSEGGIIAPMVAAQCAHIRFVVMMAGTGLTGEQILFMQGALIQEANGASKEAIETNRLQQEQIFQVLKEETDENTMADRIRAILLTHVPNSAQHREAAIKQIDAQLKQLLSPWFRFFLTHDPRADLTKVRCPVLAINGELDLQVPPQENLSAIEQALKSGGNRDVTVRELSQLNHLFQTARTGSVSEYAKIEETLSPLALETITEWILEKTD